MATIVGARSPLFYKQVKGGLPAILDTSKFTGNIFFVDSANTARGADTAGYGTSPDSPFLTIDFAITQCTANQGDVIFVLPGHAESINTAGAIDLDIAGISVIGLGNGEDRPTITVGTSLDTATVVISAAECLLKNVILQPGNDGVDILLDINADGAIVEDVELRSDETNAYQADTYIDVNGGAANAADRCTIRRCKIVSITAGAAQGIEIGAVEDALVIEDCWIDGDFTSAGLHSGSIFTNTLIRRNIISNRNSGDHAIELTAACTGLLVDNRLYGDTLGTILDPGSLKCLGNLETDAIDEAGVDSPRTSAGGFADNSITAAAIATGAIDADAIADNAIDAGAIAADAITNAKIADNAIAVENLAADAISNAKIADNALASEQFASSAGEKTCDGIVVTKATAALPQAAAAAIFTVTGHCLVKRIVGVVTTIIGAVANATKLVGNSTGAGASTDLCGTVEFNAAAVDSRFEITGTFANAMVKTVDVPLALTQTTNIVIPPGTIDVNCAGSDGGTGRVRWSITYVPLESGANIVAA